jgi:hypothetical protein
MYENGKIRTVEIILGMGEGDKRIIEGKNSTMI